MGKKGKRLLIYGGALAFLVVGFFVIAPAINFGAIQFPWVPGVVHEGNVIFYVEGVATDDTTNYDGAGSLLIVTPDTLQTKETLTMGTDTETDKMYRSGDSYIFVVKSTTANAFDHFAYPITFPTGDYAEGSLYELEWDPGAEDWILTLKLAIENQPTLLGYTPSGTVWSATGTNTYDLSDNDYEIEGTLKIAIGANYGGLGAFFDPEEDANGMLDSLYVTVTSNVTTANIGFNIPGWTRSDDGDTWFYKVPLPESGLLVRWDQEQQHGVIEIPFKLTASVLDTATTTNGAELTFTLRECQDIEDMQKGTYDSDTLTNFSSAPTAEVLDIEV